MLSYAIPPRQKPANDNGYFEQLTKAVFQAGFSWKVVNNKWPDFQRAFDGFDIDKVAAYDDRDMDRLLRDEGIVRNGRKIAATIENAREFQRIIDEHGSFHAYLRSTDDWSYAQRRKELAKRFKNFGPTGVFTFLWCVDEEVPDWEDRNK
ncbi:MAG: DNA-3-methyladenine glycosylase I [Anaerolineae bacterium]